jgi:hypothetical protein
MGSHGRRAASPTAIPGAVRDRERAVNAFNLLIGHRQLDRLPRLCHDETPRSVNRKRGIRQQIPGSMTAGFMESIV